MKRRGSTFCRTEMSKAIGQFQPGDVVVPLFIDASHAAVHGVVTDVNPAEHKVYVNWAGVTLKQHDPDEIQHADIGKISGVRRMGGRKDIVSTVFDTKEEYKKYLKEHPDADKSKHSVKPQSGGGDSKKDDAPKRKPNREVKKNDVVSFLNTSNRKPIGDVIDDYLEDYDEDDRVDIRNEVIGAMAKAGRGATHDLDMDKEELEDWLRGSSKSSLYHFLSDSFTGGMHPDKEQEESDKIADAMANAVKKTLEKYASVIISKKNVKGADTFKCPSCGTKVLKQTGYCVKCKKKVKPKEASESVSEDEQFVGDPKTHGTEKPRPGGYTIVQNLVKDLSRENKKEIKKGPRTSHRLRSRRGAYHVEKGRTYKKTKYEVDNDVVVCPRCRGEAEKQSFTKSTKLYVCPDCGWKITTDKLV